MGVYSVCVHLYNKMPIAGQTAGPIELKFFVDTHW